MSRFMLTDLQEFKIVFKKIKISSINWLDITSELTPPDFFYLLTSCPKPISLHSKNLLIFKAQTQQAQLTSFRRIFHAQINANYAAEAVKQFRKSDLMRLVNKSECSLRWSIMLCKLPLHLTFSVSSESLDFASTEIKMWKALECTFHYANITFLSMFLS